MKHKYGFLFNITTPLKHEGIFKQIEINEIRNMNEIKMKLNTVVYIK